MSDFQTRGKRDRMTQTEAESLSESEREFVVKQLRQYLYRVRQVFDHSYSSDLKRRWWPSFVLLDDMQSHLPFLIDWLGRGKMDGFEEGVLEYPECLIEFEERIGTPISAPRAFSADQKRDLYFKAGGRCCICRVSLGQDWHADHIQPWSKGGETTVENGQALCPSCNGRKKARVFTDEG